MEVVCGRCKADYEFDDALISARGTTVRCTNCGLQFKVFPPGGVSAPEEWSVVDDQGQVLSAYATLGDLQRAISLGELSADHFLVRGEEPARRLGEILELAPLLRQGASYRPPPVEPSGDRPGARPYDKTRIGLPALAEVDGPHHSPTGPPVAMRARRGPETPKIRSALSGPFLGVKVAPEPGPGTLPSGSPPQPSSRSYLPSLSATLASPMAGAPVGGARAEPRAPHVARLPIPERPGAPVPRSPGEGHSSPDGGAAEGPSRRASGRGPSEDLLSSTHPSARNAPSEPPRTPRSGAASAASRNVLASSATASMGRVSGQPKRMARAVLFVFAIVSGATLFAVTSGRAQLQRLLGESPETRAAKTETSSSASPADTVDLAELATEANALDVAWWKERLSPSSAATRQGLSQRALGLLQRLGNAPGADAAALRIDLLRIAGRLSEARKVAGDLGVDPAKHAYALTMLDLAEGSDALSYSALTSELKRSRLGIAPYLPETAVIYALTKDGDLARAELELSELRKTVQPAELPLGAELERFLRSANGTPAERIEAKPLEAERIEAEPPAAEPPTALGVASSPSNPPEVASGQGAATPAGAALPSPQAPSSRPAKAKSAPDEVQAWADQADALWSHGDQDGAVVLYQKVKKALGTKHFLGQRAAARIQQASREGADP